MLCSQKTCDGHCSGLAGSEFAVATRFAFTPPEIKPGEGASYATHFKSRKRPISRRTPKFRRCAAACLRRRLKRSLFSEPHFGVLETATAVCFFNPSRPCVATTVNKASAASPRAAGQLFTTSSPLSVPTANNAQLMPLWPRITSRTEPFVPLASQDITNDMGCVPGSGVVFRVSSVGWST
jgi:hypothetical protein